MLTAPLNWPPQSFEEWSAERDKQGRLSNFLIVRWFQEWNRRSNYRWNVLFPIEVELTRQILQRAPADTSSLSSTERDVLQLLARAFKEARATPTTPPIHVDDQLELLLCALEEMTLLTFKFMFEKRFRIRVDQDAIWKEITRPGATVEDLLRFFNSIVDSTRS